MLNRLQKSMDEKDEGFTLIELLVVIVIIGILAAIAIPLFLNQREKGAESAVKSDLKQLATIQETYFVDEGTYSAVKADLEVAGYDFNETADNNISVLSGDAEGFCLQGQHDNYADINWYYDSESGGLTETACT